VQAVGGAALNGEDTLAAGQTPERPGTGRPVEADPEQPGRGEPTAGRVMPRRWLISVLALTGVAVLLIDILTKQLAVSQLSGREPVRLLGGAVYLDVIRNSGAAFSLGTGYTFVFPLITVIVVGWIGWTARRLGSVPWAVALGLVLGGALGNLTDRIFRAPGPMVGHVVDFISLFGPDGVHYPVFNAADSSLCVGVALAVLLELTGRRVDGSRTRGRDSADVPDSARG
jgi:signal peptidase II